ncbi:MAG: hypothetical protein JW870_16780 [Candidatus Delongbacteria bacterium]|nr:hypothetical protein [Candidatus Delongbacteria bacterium]
MGERLGQDFAEVLIRIRCEHCNKKFYLRSKENEGFFKKKNNGEFFMIPTSLLKEIKCPNCKKIVEKGQIMEIKRIDKPYLFEGIVFFPETEFEALNPVLSDKEISKSLKQLTKILRFPFEEENKDNPLHQQLVRLVAIANRSLRLKRFISRLCKLFEKKIAVQYQYSHNVILEGMYGTNGVLDADPLNFLSELIFNKDFTSLNGKYKKQIRQIDYTIKEIYFLNHKIGDFLFDYEKVQIIDMFNLIEKYNTVFNVIFGFNLTEISKGQFLEEYKNLRNTIAHSHIILEKNQVNMLLWDKKSQEFSKSILNFEDLAKEMLNICAILSQILSIYHLTFQAEEIRIRGR